MAGSRKWMQYTADDDTPYAVLIDESNGELTGFEDITAANDDIPTLPRGFKMRTVSLRDPASGATRVLPVGTIAAQATIAASAGLSLSLVNDQGLIPSLTLFLVVYLKGEVKKIAFAGDTGLTDGDDT